MPSYWWECVHGCDGKRTFKEECGSRGLVHFLWDHLLPGQWDQELLVRQCPACKSLSLRIAYDFPRRNPETLCVLHIVGLGPFGDYLPMMWEASPKSDRSKMWFDFKYVRGRNIKGLNTPAVFTRNQLSNLFNLYRQKANDPTFLCE